MATAAEVQATYKAIIRVDLNATTAQAVADAINNGTTSLAIYQAGLITQSQATTQAALALSSFITGTVGDSAKVDSLTAFAKTQNDYYTNVLKSSNAQLGAYEALGRAYAADATTTASFSARYGSLSTADFITTAYGQVFTTPPTAAAIANLTAQVNYFINLYTAAGISADQAALQAKGAVLGQIIGYAATSNDAANPAPQTTVDNALVTTLNTAAAEGRTPVTTSAVYGQAISGISGAIAPLDLDVGGVGVSLDGTADGNIPYLKSTTASDTVKGTISGGVTINTAAGDDFIGTATEKVIIGSGTNVIDGSGGTDSLYATVAGSAFATTTVANVEKIYLGAAGTTTATVDTTKFTGANEIWSHKTEATITFTGLTAASKVGIDGGTAATIFTYADGAASASVALNALSGTGVTVNAATGSTTLKTVDFNVLSNSTAAITVGGSVETVKVSGAGELAISSLTSTVKTFDASAATKAIALGTASAAFDSSATISTIKLGAGNDVLTIGFAGKAQDTITLGAGADKVTVVGALGNATVDSSNKVTTFAEFTDFTKGQDTLSFSGLTKATVPVGTPTTLEATIGAVVAADAAAAAAGVAFEFGGSTYIYQDIVATGGTAGLTDGDGLIKLTGVTGLTFATANGVGTLS